MKLPNEQQPRTEAGQHFHDYALKVARDWYNNLTKQERTYVITRYKNLDSYIISSQAYLYNYRDISQYLPHNITVNQLREAVGL